MTNRDVVWLDDIRAVIFDMDGVIIDSEPLHEKAQEEVFGRFDLDVPHSEMMTFKGRTEVDVFRDVLDRHGNGRYDLATVVNAKHEAYRKLLRDVEPIDGVLELVRALHGHLPLALTTSAASDNQRFVFDRLKLDDYFDVVVTAADVVNSKPHPEPYLMTAQRLGVSPEETVVFEDSRYGIQSARAAGCRVIGVIGTFSREDLEKESPDLIIEQFDELSELPAFIPS